MRTPASQSPSHDHGATCMNLWSHCQASKSRRGGDQRLGYHGGMAHGMGEHGLQLRSWPGFILGPGMSDRSGRRRVKAAHWCRPMVAHAALSLACYTYIYAYIDIHAYICLLYIYIVHHSSNAGLQVVSLSPSLSVFLCLSVSLPPSLSTSLPLSESLSASANSTLESRRMSPPPRVLDSECRRRRHRRTSLST
jgi:hypothetical protein